MQWMTSCCLFCVFYCGITTADPSNNLKSASDDGIVQVNIPINEVLWAVSSQEDWTDALDDKVLLFHTDNGTAGVNYKLTVEFFSNNTCTTAVGSPQTYTGLSTGHTNAAFYITAGRLRQTSGCAGGSFLRFTDENNEDNQTACTAYTVVARPGANCFITSGSPISMPSLLTSGT